MNGSYRLLIIRHEPHTPAAHFGVPRAGSQAPPEWHETALPCVDRMDDNWMEGWRREEVRMMMKRRRYWKRGGYIPPLSPGRQNTAVIFITAPLLLLLILAVTNEIK